jgi:hypothetical protein
MKKVIALLAVAILSGCGSSNVPEVKAHAAEVWKQAGFEVIGYEGYTNEHCFFAYGCGHVWSTLKRIPDNGIIYHGYIEKWGSEYHIYNLQAVDAIKPNGAK